MNSYIDTAVVISDESAARAQTTDCNDKSGGPFPSSISLSSSSSLSVSSSSSSPSFISRLPSDALQLVLSFLPTPLTLRSVALASHRFAVIALNDIHWRRLWAVRTAECFAHYIRDPSPLVLLAEVPCDALPNFATIETHGGVQLRATSTNTIRIELCVRPIASADISAVAHCLAMRMAQESNPLLIRKALYYLQSGNGERAVIDNIMAVRVFFLSFSFPPPGQREGTISERETSLIDMCDALAHAWHCCQCPQSHQLLQDPQAHTKRLIRIAQSEDLEDVTEAEVIPARTGREAADVFFPFAAAEPESLLIYAYLLRHVSLSDIHHHIRTDERKCAMCSRIISPSGHSVELRFFSSSLLGSYPRFFVKAVFAVGDLPRTRIQEIFDRGGDAEPQLTTLFHGGFGRVEVDIVPTVSREGFAKLREALGLSAAFPMPLLWNVLIMATGSGGLLLMEAQPSFEAYYGTSFTAALTEAFAADG